MPPAVALALKDLRILTRIPGAFFFTFVWPLLVAIFFGTIFGSPSRATPTLPIAVVDEDAGAEAKAFVDGLAKRGAFDVLRVSRADATTLVKQGKRVAAVIVPSGFGAASRRVFQGAAPQVEIAIDPSRQAESAMLQGLLMAQAGERLQTVLNDPSQGRAVVADSLRAMQQAPGGLATGIVPVERFLKELDTFLETQQKQQASGGKAAGGGWKPLEVKVSSVAKDDSGPKSGYDITFPQGLLWGIIGCTMSFAMSLATERSQGTMTRLRMSPAPASTLLLGKALACYLTILIVEALLVAIGTLLLGLRIGSPVLFALAALVAPLGFVGIMMLISALLRTEQAGGGIGWAIMMPLAMIGGVMIPLIAMPPWLLSLSNISPMKWAILSYEGAIWRGFSFGDMLQPLAILLTVGLITFGIGSRILSRMAERV
jgi:ABC-2 type transport system permease protein